MLPVVTTCHAMSYLLMANTSKSPRRSEKTSLSGWHQVIVRYILYFVWRQMVSLAAPLVILWRQAAILGVACEGTEILELLVTHGATFIKLTCSIPGRFSWNSRLVLLIAPCLWYCAVQMTSIIASWDCTKKFGTRFSWHFAIVKGKIAVKFAVR